ncbi:hypothetical protein SCP_1203050 [Sparassis crispa]|uniref:Uncharacterized protein n=1 Tax=Sparassis crispa TaxID=139825 RepID=A0A401H0W9_9APHY|nr:hypothetical protein SCP_1203050 [Sparassis crispa]GBE88076.1 hypothetical protein SCP_1203050 [Sparassis crispa]
MARYQGRRPRSPSSPPTFALLSVASRTIRLDCFWFFLSSIKGALQARRDVPVVHDSPANVSRLDSWLRYYGVRSAFRIEAGT